MTDSHDPRTVTFQVLARSPHTDALDALLSSLKVSDAACRRFGLQALLQKPDSVPHLIQRIGDLPDDVCDSLARQPHVHYEAVRQCLQRNEHPVLRSTLEFMRRCACVMHADVLVTLPEHPDDGIRAAASRTLTALAEQLALRTRTGNRSYVPGHDDDHCRAIRIDFLKELDRTVSRYRDLANPQPVIDAILILGNPDDKAVRRVCSQRGNDCADRAEQALKTLDSRAVFHTISDALKLPAPPGLILQVLHQRDDLPFVVSLLQSLPQRISTLTGANIRRAGTLPWLKRGPAVLENIPFELHDRVVALLSWTALDDNEKDAIRTWIVRHSCGAARAAASEILTSLPRDEVHSILFEALESTEPDVEVWATRHLRNQQVPDMFQHLLNRLDSDRQAVRDAAREELKSFTMERVLDLFESLPPSTRIRCGELLRKINPNAIETVRTEMSHPFHRRRIRAANAAGELGFADDLLSSLTQLCVDDEWTVRQAAIGALSCCTSPEALAFLLKLPPDDHRQVREAVDAAIRRLNERRQPVSRQLAVSGHSQEH